MTFFFPKIIFAKTHYNIYNNKLFIIIKDFKIWKHYLKGYKYEVFKFTNYNNLQQFINIKNLSYKVVY